MTHEQLEQATREGVGDLKLTSDDWDQIIADERNAAKFVPVSRRIEDAGYVFAGSYNNVALWVKFSPEIADKKRS